MRERPLIGSLMQILYHKGFSREDIASKLKVSVSAVRSWEKETRRPSWVAFYELQKLSKTKGV